MDELIDKPTTHTYIEEKEIFIHLLHGAVHIGHILHQLRLSTLRSQVSAVCVRAKGKYYAPSLVCTVLISMDSFFSILFTLLLLLLFARLFNIFILFSI